MSRVSAPIVIVCATSYNVKNKNNTYCMNWWNITNTRGCTSAIACWFVTTMSNYSIVLWRVVRSGSITTTQAKYAAVGRWENRQTPSITESGGRRDYIVSLVSITSSSMLVKPLWLLHTVQKLLKWTKSNVKSSLCSSIGKVICP